MAVQEHSELLEDLESKFLESYREGDERAAVEKYGHYFLGSIVLDQEHGYHYIIDGQQRLTSLTLLLIYLAQSPGRPRRPGRHPAPHLLEKFGKHSYNLDVPERNACIEALFRGKSP